MIRAANLRSKPDIAFCNTVLSEANMIDTLTSSLSDAVLQNLIAIPPTDQVTAPPLNSEQATLIASNWIWLPEREVLSDQYTCFRRSFYLEELDKDAYIAISADSDFVVWLNGEEVGRGQFSDFATSKTWSRFTIGDSLHQGKNLLAVLVYHRGEDFLDHQGGHPGLILSLRSGLTEIVTDHQWRVSQHPAFRSGFAERMTAQCGFTFAFDARLDEPWQTLSYDDTHWTTASIVQYRGIGDIWRELTPRPLPCLALEGLSALRVVAQGSYIQTKWSVNAAESMMQAALCGQTFPWHVFENQSLEDASANSVRRLNPGTFVAEGAIEPLTVRAPDERFDGRYFIADLGQETVGLLEFEVEASPGTIIEIGHGEQLDDGRVRVCIGGRNFADRYICGEKRHRFQMPFRRLGARYLQIHCSDSVKFHRLGLRPVIVRGASTSIFKTHDTLANEIHTIAVRTLNLCRHEHYEDCPWREQALYGYDGRLQALYGYYAFGDYRFPEVSFSLLGKSLDERGLLQLTAPSRWESTIPIFTFAWISALAEHMLYSGDASLFFSFHKEIAIILSKAFSQFDQKTELYRTPEDASLWHFYEWTPGLTGATSHETRSSSLFEASYNLYLHEAGRNQAWMLRQTGAIEASDAMEQRLRSLRKAIHRNFWDISVGFYRSTLENGTFTGAHELVQILALGEGVVPFECQESVTESIYQGKTYACMLSAFYYRIRALTTISVESRQWLDSSLERTWSQMALSGATTLWETAQGSEDFYFAGSLCHGWSALPVYYHQACVLGIQPLTPAFRTFTVKVYPSRFFWAQGEVPTPFGSIEVFWEKTDSGLSIEIKAPLECTPKLEAYPEAPVALATCNGQAIFPSHS